MIDKYDLFTSDSDLPISEEMLGAYAENQLSDIDSLLVENQISGSIELSDLLASAMEINDINDETYTIPDAEEELINSLEVESLSLEDEHFYNQDLNFDMEDKISFEESQDIFHNVDNEMDDLTNNSISSDGFTDSDSETNTDTDLDELDDFDDFV